MNTPTRDETEPKGKWEFDVSVTNAFDDMLARSIPQYELMRDTVFRLGSRFVQSGTAIVDLGCSRGEAMAPFIDRFGAFNRHVGVEISDPMLTVAQERFKGFIDSAIVSIRKMDLRNEYPSERVSLTLAVLTLQFIPIEYRQKIVRNVFKTTVEGGAFIVVEKVLSATADIDQHFTDLYWTMKKSNGYSDEQIEKKRLSLEGVLVPVTARWNEELLRQAGFQQVDCFWRWMNFAGWIGIK